MYINYSCALYSLAEDSGITDKVLSQLEEIEKALSENPDFALILDSHTVKRDERLAAADGAFMGAEEIVQNFIKILAEKHLVHCFDKFVSAYRKEYDEKHGISYVTADTVIPLSDALTAALGAKLEELTGKKIVLQNRVNPEILGGIVLKTEDSEIDASLLGQLQDLAKGLSDRY